MLLQYPEPTLTTPSAVSVSSLSGGERHLRTVLPCYWSRASCRHVLWAPNTLKMRLGKVAGGCKCHPIFVKRNLTTEADVVAAERTVYSLIKFYTITSYILFRVGGVCLNIQNTPLSLQSCVGS